MTERTATWLHVSDVHVGAGDAADEAGRKYALEAAGQVATEEFWRLGWNPDWIAITGDVAFSGGDRSDEYRAADDQLDVLCSALGVERDRVYTIPGNHDVARSTAADPDVARMLRLLRSESDPDDVDNTLASPGDKRRLVERLSSYLDFARAWGTGFRQSYADGLWWTAKVPCSGLTVGLIGLNSSLLALDDSDESRLQLGQQQLQAAADLGDDVDVRVALTHHPFSWLRDGARAEARLRAQGISVHMFGHLHVPDASSVFRPGTGALVRLGAGALWEKTGDRFTPTGGFAFSLNQLVIQDSGEAWVDHVPLLMSPGAQRFVIDSSNCDDGLRHARLPLVVQASATSRSNAARSPMEIATRQMRAFGFLRTAHPIDLTLGEVYDDGLFVPSQLMTDRGRAQTSMSEFATQRLQPQAVHVVLGEPGAGKSFALYEAGRALFDAGQVPVICRAASVLADAELRSDLSGCATAEGVVLLVDAVDEASRGDADVVAGWIAELAAACPVVVTCRAADFADLAPSLTAVPTASIGELREWSVDGDFASYLDRAAPRSGADPAAIMDVVVGTTLEAFAARPLFARMLLFVLESLGPADYSSARRLQSPAQLYDRYFAFLAARTRADLVARGCEDLSPYQAWIDLAREVWRGQSQIGDLIPASAWTDVVAGLGEHSPLCARDALPFGSHRERFGTSYYTLTHYSYFEYLLAVAVWSALDSESLADASSLLRWDLSREVRHFVSGIAEDSGRVPALRSLYDYIAATAESAPERLRAQNLVIYFMSRLAPQRDQTELLALADAEEDVFLHTALVWAGCHSGSREALDRFLSGFDRDDVRSAYRGYVRYYYGDIPFGSEPPFLDNPPFLEGDTRRTDAVLPARLISPGPDVSLERRVVDLMTYLDVKGVRDTGVEKRLIDTAADVSALAGDSGRRLAAMVDEARRRHES